MVEHLRALLFGGNVVLEKLSASTEIDNQGLDPRFPYRGIIRIPKMVPTFHSGYSECSDLEQAGGPGLSIARTAPHPRLNPSGDRAALARHVATGIDWIFTALRSRTYRRPS